MSSESALREIVGIFSKDSSCGGEIGQEAKELIEREKLNSRVAWALGHDDSSGIGTARLLDNQLKALERFDAEAKKLFLSYVVIKGLPLSQVIYRDCRVRASRDIDILVSQEDLPKAHTVALKAGFVQVAEGFRARQLAAMGALSQMMLEGVTSDYPITTDRSEPHLLPYLRTEEDGSVTILDLRCTCRGLPKSAVAPIVSLPSVCDVDGVQVPVPRSAFSFIILLLEAYEACEGIHANCREESLGLKYLIDLHCWLQKGAPLSGVSKFVFNNGILREVGRVLYDLIQLFPEAYQAVEHLCPLYESPWGLPYDARLLDCRARHDNALSVVSRAIEAQAADQDDVVAERLFGSVEYVEFPAKGQVRKEEHRCIIEWLIDEEALELELPNLVFNVSLLLESSGCSHSSLGVGFCMSREKDQWKLGEKELYARDLDGHISKRFGSDVSRALEISRRGRFLRLAFVYELPTGIAGKQVCAFVSFHRHEFGGVYHIIQGERPVAPLSQMISKGLVLDEACHVGSARLAYRLMWKTIQAGAHKQKSPYFGEDGHETALGWFMLFGELGATWTDGASVDPAIYEGFEEKMSQKGLLDSADAAETLAFVKEYLLEQAPLFDCTGEDSADVLLSIFEKELADEEWEAKYDELTKGLIAFW